MMVSSSKKWVRFKDLPDDMLDDMPAHVRATFLAARRHGFEVEMLCAGGRAAPERRAPRRFVLVADDIGKADSGGPLNFDLAALARDVRASNRLFVVSTQPTSDRYAAAYAAAVEDLGRGYTAAVVVETRAPFAHAWARTLAALRGGGCLAAGPNPINDQASFSSRKRGYRRRAC